MAEKRSDSQRDPVGAAAVFRFDTDQPEGKRTKFSLNWDKCLCHGRSSSVGKLEKFTETSWHKFCQAAKRRRDDVYQLMREYIDGEKPVPRDVTALVKHHNCYASYVLEKTVKRIESARQYGPSGSEDTEETDSGNRRTRSATPSCDRSLCIICQEVKKLASDRRRPEKVHPLTLSSSVKTMIQAAEIRNDERVLMELRGGVRGAADPIAGDVLVHHSCQSKYTHKRSLMTLEQPPDEEEPAADPYDQAFDIIANDVKVRVIDGMEVLQMSDLLQQFIQLLGDFGIMRPEYRSEKLKKHLMKSFSDQISFWHPKFRRGSEVIFSDVQPGRIVEAGMAASSKLQEEEIVHDVQLSEDRHKQYAREAYHTTQMLRQAIMQVEDMEWPPLPEHITTEAAQASIPTSLFNVLAWIVNADTSIKDGNDISLHVPAPVSQSAKTRILSIAQDIIFLTRNGRIRTPKHVSLAVSVHHKTGSMQLVSTLNQLGHCISKSKLQEVETALTEVRLQQQNANIIPSNITPHVPVTFVWDNNDIREETATGEGTTHCTNGIVIQAVVSGCRPQSAHKPTAKHHRRSVREEPRQLLEFW